MPAQACVGVVPERDLAAPFDPDGGALEVGGEVVGLQLAPLGHGRTFLFFGRGVHRGQARGEAANKEIGGRPRAHGG